MIERIAIQAGQNIEQAVSRAAEVLSQGRIILYPTDTLYGLGADSLNPEAVQIIYDIKGRLPDKPLHSIVAHMAMADRYVEVTEMAQNLAEKFLPGPLTLVMKKRDVVPDTAVRGLDTFGIRIPDNAFCLELAKKFNGPYTATSANRSGATPLRTADEVLKQLGHHAGQISLIIDQGELPPKQPSTVVDVSTHKMNIIREGAMTLTELIAQV